MSKRRAYRIMPGAGVPCPKCKRPTQIREHKELTHKHLVKQPYYFTRWFYCRNTNCNVTAHMAEQFKVINPRAS
jgi:aspartate carbamoyltransferase regulatory subunit